MVSTHLNYDTAQKLVFQLVHFQSQPSTFVMKNVSNVILIFMFLSKCFTEPSWGRKFFAFMFVIFTVGNVLYQLVIFNLFSGAYYFIKDYEIHRRLRLRLPMPSGNCICSICLDRFYHPVYLSCDHTFCQKCIIKWFEKSDKFTCPYCQVECAPYR